MLELERLGVRVVSGRLGRKVGDDDEPGVSGMASDSKKNSMVSTGMAGLGTSPSMERSNSIGWGADGDLNRLIDRRPSLGGLSFPTEARRGSLGSFGQVVGLDGDMAQVGLGGGFMGDASRRQSSLGLGSLAGGGIGGMGMSVNPNQHYEMLKLHHMNLLNEIQETTLMMNLYQQQQLQQQQQQLQQQQDGLSGVDPMSALMGTSGMDAMFGAGQLSQQQRASLGLGNFGSAGPLTGMMQQQPAPTPKAQQQSPLNLQQRPKQKEVSSQSKQDTPKTDGTNASSSASKRQGDNSTPQGGTKKVKTEAESEAGSKIKEDDKPEND